MEKLSRGNETIARYLSYKIDEIFGKFPMKIVQPGEKRQKTCVNSDK